MEAAPVLYAVDEKVLVGYHQHQAYVARPVRAGDDTVLVRWESTGAREEVAVGDVKKIDLDAKRPRRKRRDASAAQTEASAPARREPPRKRRKKKADADNDESSSVDTTPSVAAIRAEYQREQEAARAAASDAEEDAGAEDPSSVREEIERHLKTLQAGDTCGQSAAVYALEDLANKDNANRTAIAQRLVGLLSDGSADDQEQATRVLGNLADDAANQVAIAEAGAIEALVALLTNGTADGQYQAVVALRKLTFNSSTNKDAIREAGGIAALVALVAHGRATRWAGSDALDGIAASALATIACGNEVNMAAITVAGGIEALVDLVRSGTGYYDQGRAAEALWNLADAAANRAAIAKAGGIAALCRHWVKYPSETLAKLALDEANRASIARALVALVANGTVGGQEAAVVVLRKLVAWDNANLTAIVSAGGVDALSALMANGSGEGKEYARLALEELGPLAEYASRLQSENASLRRRLDRYEGTGKIDMTQDDDGDDAQHRDTGLRDLRERKAQAKFAEVKKEKEALEDRVLCTICMEADAPRTVLFGPCNHFLACASCADALQECPNCRVPITARTAIANTS